MCPHALADSTLLFEGKLGVGRPGRAEYEKQAGERGIIVWTKPRAPTDSDMIRDASLFVVNEQVCDNASVSSWGVAAMSVSAAVHNCLHNHVESEFTWHCNALPPQYIRVLYRDTGGTVGITVTLQIASAVQRYSFDTTSPVAGGGGGVVGVPIALDPTANFGLSGRVMDSVQDGTVTLMHAGLALYDVAVPSPGDDNLRAFPLSPKSFSVLANVLDTARIDPLSSSFISVRPAGKCWEVWVQSL